MYDTDATFPVYEMHEWWSDKWDALEYSQDIDWEKPVFEQLKTIHQKVPRAAIMNFQSENTDYCNMSGKSKNCYLVFGCVGNEDCCYGHIVWQSRRCFDCLYVYKSEECYECVDCVQCYNLKFSNSCDNCSDSEYLINCAGCRNCFGCVGLKNQEYYIFNKKYSKIEYEQEIKRLKNENSDIKKLAQEKLKELQNHEIVKYFHGFNCEDVTGDYLYNCKNVLDSYDLKNCENCRYCATLDSFTNVYDCNFATPPAEWCYNCVTVQGYQLISCHLVQNSSEMYYCDQCYNSKNCFGSLGLKNKQYCIFNKQYTKEEYEMLLPKLIELMKKNNEWGEFLPPYLSPFAYNETIAYKYFPLTQEETLGKGWRWKDMNEGKFYKGPQYDIPENIKDVSDDICKQVLTCEFTKKPYKIIPQELAFYRNHDLPIPHLCPDERHNNRMKLRNPRHLWDRTCMKCKKNIKTTYAPERPETVYCEKCFLEAIY